MNSKEMIETTDWDALDEEMTNTTYDISEMRPVPPEIEAGIREGADNTLRRIRLEKLRAEVDDLQVEVQAKTDSLRSRVDDLVLAK
ncbi:MAG: hypothetical protein LBL41_05360 [Bifidobacteriaceae bacterium]|jgi:hypothetical protein|nr:hypothetical protein [Bifidobacteriaceae bacterium]